MDILVEGGDFLFVNPETLLQVYPVPAARAAPHHHFLWDHFSRRVHPPLLEADPCVLDIPRVCSSSTGCSLSEEEGGALNTSR